MPTRSKIEDSENRVYLNEVEASTLTGMSVSWLRNQRCRNEGPKYIKVGNGSRGAVRYRKDELVAWMELRAVTPSRSQ